MITASLDPRRRVLCGRANAERVAIGISAKAGEEPCRGQSGQHAPAFLRHGDGRTHPVRSNCKLSSCDELAAGQAVT